MLPAAQSLSSRSSGVVLEELVAVPIDVGKHTAMAKVVDFTGATLRKPFTFRMDRAGVADLVTQVRAVLPGTVALVRVGLEAAGHYHLPLCGGVLPGEWELRILNPGHVAVEQSRFVSLRARLPQSAGAADHRVRRVDGTDLCFRSAIAARRQADRRGRQLRGAFPRQNRGKAPPEWSVRS